MKNRVASLLDHLGWTQGQLADHLGVSRSVVSRMCSGQAEPGPVSKLLDALAAEQGREDLIAAAFVPAPQAVAQPAQAEAS